MSMRALRWLACCVLASLAGTAHAQNDQRVKVFTEYVRQLASAHALQVRFAGEMAAAQPQDRLYGLIGSSTRVKADLKRNMQALRALPLAAPHDRVVAEIVDLYEKKITLLDTLNAVATQLLSPPKPGVDYSQYGAELPRITAVMDNVDRRLYELTPAVCGLLVDEHTNAAPGERLIVSAAQRKQLLEKIEAGFGASLKEKNQTYTLGTAAKLRDCLRG